MTEKAGSRKDRLSLFILPKKDEESASDSSACGLRMTLAMGAEYRGAKPLCQSFTSEGWGCPPDPMSSPPILLKKEGGTGG